LWGEKPNRFDKTGRHHTQERGPGGVFSQGPSQSTGFCTTPSQGGCGVVYPFPHIDFQARPLPPPTVGAQTATEKVSGEQKLVVEILVAKKKECAQQVPKKPGGGVPHMVKGPAHCQRKILGKAKGVCGLENENWWKNRNNE